MAMAAWSAKVSTSPICEAANGSTARRAQPITPMGTPSLTIGTARKVRYPAARSRARWVRRS